MNLADTVRLERAAILDRVATAIDDQPLDEAGFKDALKAVRAAGVQAKQIAERHGMAVSTITRWEQGVNTPAPAIVRPLTRSMAVLARRCADALRAECAPAPAETPAPAAAIAA